MIIEMFVMASRLIGVNFCVATLKRRLDPSRHSSMWIKLELALFVKVGMAGVLLP